MSWRVETRADGSAKWSGSDAVLDPWRHRTGPLFFGGAGCLGLVLFALGWFVVAGTVAVGAELVSSLQFLSTHPDYWVRRGGRVLSQAALVVAGLCTVGGAVWAFKKWGGKVAAPGRFFVRGWSLTGHSDGTLCYQAGEFSRGLDWGQVSPPIWRVTPDQVARVEVADSAAWQPARVYPGSMSSEPVPLKQGHESQAFLFMADGSRRVIYTVAGGREGAATLAASVRSWLEAYRASAALPAPIARASLPDASNSEGFDL